MEQLTESQDTIVAPLTAAGGAVAAIRLSGQQALAIAGQLAPTSFTRRSHQLYQVRLRDQQGQGLDEAMVVEMHGPASYTGEDVVELYVHGSGAVVRAVLKACFALGARLAEPGEFTARAVHHGKMDLLQAEGVGALIRAETEEERVGALRQVSGELSTPLQALYEQLRDVTARIQAQLDFPDMVGELDDLLDVQQLLALQGQVRQLLQHRRTVATGLPLVVLAGMSNGGKSSLLNRWVDQQRVLVHEEAGTTRDAVEVVYHGQRCSYRLMDTAGLRESSAGLAADSVEQQGIALGQRFVSQAQVVLWLIPPEQLTAETSWPARTEQLEHVAVVASKVDLEPGHGDAVKRRCQALGLPFVAAISQTKANDVLPLQQWVEQRLLASAPAKGSMLLSTRQEQALQQLAEQLQLAIELVQLGGDLDVLLADMQAATSVLARLLGREGRAELFEQVFGQFCLGK